MVCQHRRNVPQPPPPPQPLYLLVIPGTNLTILIFCLILQNSAKQKQQGLEVKNILSDLKSPMFITIVIGLGLVFLVFLTGFIWHKYCRLRRKNTAENTSHASETGECLGK